MMQLSNDSWTNNKIDNELKFLGPTTEKKTIYIIYSTVSKDQKYIGIVLGYDTLNS